jgi:hypothetical protein
MPASNPRVLWNAQQCADHLQIATTTWRNYVADRKRTGAPAPATPAHATTTLWAALDVLAFAVRHNAAKRQAEEARLAAHQARENARQARRTRLPSPSPDSPHWTARQCADHHGIAPRGWRLAVRRGDAPAPITPPGTAIPLWDADAVRTVTCFEGTRPLS